MKSIWMDQGLQDKIRSSINDRKTDDEFKELEKSKLKAYNI